MQIELPKLVHNIWSEHGTDYTTVECWNCGNKWNAFLVDIRKSRKSSRCPKCGMYNRKQYEEAYRVYKLENLKHE